ncbi:MAG: hypothetical protein H6966_09770 [Chromatiaceae bacterium]|nr:hypothetical protein [Chromatiaceae bacterium]
MECVVYIGNSNQVRLLGLRNATTGEYENNGSVSCVLKDSAGDNIQGETWPKSMSYVTGSDGDYVATISPLINVNHKQELVAEITATASGLTGFWQRPCRVKTRT